MTPKDHTLAMLAHYLHEVAYDRISPEIILVHAGGVSNWCGITLQRKADLLVSELTRMDAFNDKTNTPHR